MRPYIHNGVIFLLLFLRDWSSSFFCKNNNSLEETMFLRKNLFQIDVFCIDRLLLKQTEMLGIFTKRHKERLDWSIPYHKWERCALFLTWYVVPYIVRPLPFRFFRRFILLIKSSSSAFTVWPEGLKSPRPEKEKSLSSWTIECSYTVSSGWRVNGMGFSSAYGSVKCS